MSENDILTHGDPSNPPAQIPPASLETRNVLDPLGNIIGQLSLPVGTSEIIWSARLLSYSSQIQTALLNLLDTLVTTATGTVTTSSGTAATINGMSVIPEKGTYIILFSGNIYTDGASAKGEFGIYVNGVLLTDTKRSISCALTLLGGLVSVSLNAIGVGTNTNAQMSLDGSQIVEVKFKSTNGGTIGFIERSLILLKVKDE